jgi:hypothetical protein
MEIVLALLQEAAVVGQLDPQPPRAEKRPTLSR